MKLAYLGFDKTLLKTNTVLSQYFAEIDYYLVNENLEANSLNFFSLPIMANNVCIPTDESLYTNQHKSVLFKIKNEFTLLKKNIFSDYRLTGDEITGTKKSLKNQFGFSDIESIFFDRKKKNYQLQTRSNGMIEYDYLIIQGHQLVTDQLQTVKQNVIGQQQLQSYLMLNLEFPASYKLHDAHLRQDFIFIDNTNFNTVFDNWYVCSYSANKLTVSLIIPTVQHHSEELQEFVAARSRQVLNDSLSSFEIGPVTKKWISCIDGYVTQKMTVSFPKHSSVFPSFDYWTQNKVNNYIKNIFVVKNKKNPVLFNEKEV